MWHDSFIIDTCNLRCSHFVGTSQCILCGTAQSVFVYFVKKHKVASLSWYTLWESTKFTKTKWQHQCSYVWHDSCVCVTWLIRECDMTRDPTLCSTLVWQHESPHKVHKVHTVYKEHKVGSRVMSHSRMSHVTHTHEWWVVSHIQMSHKVHTTYKEHMVHQVTKYTENTEWHHESCRTDEWVTLHIRMNHVTPTNSWSHFVYSVYFVCTKWDHESCHKYKRHSSHLVCCSAQVSTLGAQSTAYPTCSDIFKSSKQSPKPQIIGLFSLKHGKRDLRALASGFALSFWKCYCRWDRVYAQYRVYNTIYKAHAVQGGEDS